VQTGGLRILTRSEIELSRNEKSADQQFTGFDSCVLFEGSGEVRDGRIAQQCRNF